MSSIPRFYEGKYLAAIEKQRIADRFEWFVKSGFKRSLFSKGIYKQLSLHFGFIAHYDINGFYAVRFDHPQGRIDTIRSIANASQWCFVDENTSGCADLNRAMQVTCLKYFKEIMSQADDDFIALKQAQINELQKHIDNHVRIIQVK